MLDQLDHDERLRLLRFACSFAWTDLEVQPEERVFIASLAERLGLSDAELARVQAWLKVPPRPEEVDPTQVPVEHRQVFVDALTAVVERDNVVSPDEAEMLELFKQLVG